MKSAAMQCFLHDLNNQLLIILGFSELLLETVPQTDSRRTDVQAIETATQIAVALVSQSPLLK